MRSSDPCNTKNPIGDHHVDSLPSWVLSPLLPKVIVPILMVAFLLIESLVHVALLHEGEPFLSELFTPQPHEAWMRGLVLLMIGAIGALWLSVALERRKRIDALCAYQTRLQDMAGRLAYGDSEQRRELARRLHEDVGQQLTAARMFLGEIDTETSGAEKTISRILERLVLECREIAEELSPPVLEEYGLVAALESLASRVMRRSGRSVQVEADNACHGLDRESLLVTFQALAEVVEAAAVEPDTTRVVVECGQRGGALVFTVRWNGGGSDEFFSVEQRIGNIGGTTDLRADAVSTVFTALVPVAA